MNVSDSWSNTRSSMKRLKAVWGQADEDVRWDIGFWGAGLIIMGASIVIQFGWVGLLFCTGVLIWHAGNHALRR